jgi:hypothetical protein
MGYGSSGGFGGGGFSGAGFGASSFSNKGGFATGSALKKKEEKPTKRGFLINISLFISYLITFILNIIYSDLSENISKDYFHLKYIIMCFGTALVFWVSGLFLCLVFYFIYLIIEGLYSDFINLYIKKQ